MVSPACNPPLLHTSPRFCRILSTSCRCDMASPVAFWRSPLALRASSRHRLALTASESNVPEPLCVCRKPGVGRWMVPCVMTSPAALSPPTLPAPPPPPPPPSTSIESKAAAKSVAVTKAVACVSNRVCLHTLVDTRMVLTLVLDAAGARWVQAVQQFGELAVRHLDALDIAQPFAQFLWKAGGKCGETS